MWGERLPTGWRYDMTLTKSWNGDVIIDLIDLLPIPGCYYGYDSRLKYTPNFGIFVHECANNKTIGLTFLLAP